MPHGRASRSTDRPPPTPTASPTRSWTRCGYAAVRCCGSPTADFLRPASLRYEFGRTNPDAYYEGWLDESGLRREVLDRLGPGGTGRVLPSLWDTATDRGHPGGVRDRAARHDHPRSGPLLLGGGLPFEYTVHLALSEAALARRTPPDARWTLPAFARYRDEVAPESVADVVVRLDDPRRPALVEAR